MALAFEWHGTNLVPTTRLMMPHWTDLPAQLTRTADRLDRHRTALFSVVGATWFLLAASVLTFRTTTSRPLGIVLAVAIAIALVGQWVFFLWAWFRSANVRFVGTWARARTWIRTVFLFAFGAVVIYLSWTMASSFARF